MLDIEKGLNGSSVFENQGFFLCLHVCYFLYLKLVLLCPFFNILHRSSHKDATRTIVTVYKVYFLCSSMLLFRPEFNEM